MAAAIGLAAGLRSDGACIRAPNLTQREEMVIATERLLQKQMSTLAQQNESFVASGRLEGLR